MMDDETKGEEGGEGAAGNAGDGDAGSEESKNSDGVGARKGAIPHVEGLRQRKQRTK